MKNIPLDKQDFKKFYDQESYWLGSEDREKLEYNFAKFILKQAKDPKTVLDIGCGTGELLSAFLKLGLNVWGVDKSLYALKIAGKKVNKSNLKRVDVLKEKLPFSDNSFDIVCALDLVEHLLNEDNFFREVSRILKKGGVLFLTTPNHNSIFGFIFKNFVKDDPTHINLNKEKYWVKKVKSFGFKIKELKTIALFGFPPTRFFRNIFTKIGLPIMIRPFFTPIRSLGSTILILAQR
jgi:2-polyprenyl-3-methyl-5-hydroxy-6-metoxy-1,4-benzoquinol methylase